MDFLDGLGLASVERERIDTPDEASVAAAIARWTDKVTSGAQPFPVDGLVVAYDDTDYAKTGSVTGHHATRAGLAFKWADETAATVLEEIEWSCAVASISPVAVFRPVPLEGTTVKRASLCNISECERLGIGGPGTELSVIKAPYHLRPNCAIGFSCSRLPFFIRAIRRLDNIFIVIIIKPVFKEEHGYFLLRFITNKSAAAIGQVEHLQKLTVLQVFLLISRKISHVRACPNNVRVYSHMSAQCLFLRRREFFLTKLY